jgi:hypothetical protein
MRQRPRDIPGVIAFAEETVQGRYGGAWVTNGSADEVLHIGVVNPTNAEVSTIRDKAPLSVTVKIHEVKYSKTELDQFSKRLERLLDSRRESKMLALATRSDLNQVEVIVSGGASELEDEIRDIVPADAVTVRGSQWEAEAVGSSDSGPTSDGVRRSIIALTTALLLCAAALLGIGLMKGRVL